MATDEEKKQNMFRLTKLTLYGLTAGIWDLMGEGALGLSHEIGDQILPVLEKEMGLELAGESLLDIAQEVCRLAVDEFGLAQDVEASGDENMITLKVKDYILRQLFDELIDAGVSKPFICPLLCTGNAILDRVGIKAMSSIEKWDEGNGVIIIWEVI